jgi:hypothetical protein
MLLTKCSSPNAPHQMLLTKCSSPNIIRVIKSRRIRWALYVALMGLRRGVNSVWVGKPEGKSLSGKREWMGG